MDGTPRSSRLHIAILGRRNAGKSSLVNALTGQEVALVSTVAGTTTDPVWKSMEMAPIGPVVIVDTAGIDDTGGLGRLRVERTRRILRQADIAVVVLDLTDPPGEPEEGLLIELRAAAVPVVTALNKADAAGPGLALDDTAAVAWARRKGLEATPVSALTGQGLGRLRQALIAAAPSGWEGPPVIGDLLTPGDMVILVVPIDIEAPKGRLILPQVQVLRDILDHEALAAVVKVNQLAAELAALAPLTPSRPRLVVTDSQVLSPVAGLTPLKVPLTTFSILLARRKGDLPLLARGAERIDRLERGDSVLVAEACSHHPVGDDIGRVKIPRWLEERAGGPLSFTHVAGGDFPDPSGHKLIVHCGGCMINRKEMLNRLWVAEEAGIPMVNYGVAIAHLHGLLPRALAPFRLNDKLGLTPSQLCGARSHRPATSRLS